MPVQRMPSPHIGAKTTLTKASPAARSMNIYTKNTGMDQSAVSAPVNATTMVPAEPTDSPVRALMRPRPTAGSGALTPGNGSTGSPRDYSNATNSQGTIS